MQVSDKVKNAYQVTGAAKYITLEFPELDMSISTGDGLIHQESMSLSEGLVNSSSIEFVGCISSKFKIQINNLDKDVKGKKISVKIHTEGTEEEPVQLFRGIVDSAVKQSNKRVKEITAYDELYTKGNTEVSEWYKSLKFPITLKDLRDSLFNYIGLTQTETTLPNDNIVIDKQYSPNTLQALSIIKAICQVNGAFGIINRNGAFEYRIFGEIKERFYSGFYPDQDPFSRANSGTTEFTFYKSVSYEEFTVKPVDKITIRQSESQAGITYGSGDNNYIIQGNIFTLGLSDDLLLQIAKNIYPNIHGFSYHPFTSENNGLPYLECGVDVASYMMIDFDATEETGEIVYKRQNFYILNRELTGIQALNDSYSAKGEEYQNEFITDLNIRVDTVVEQLQSTIGSLQDYSMNYVSFTNLEKVTVKDGETVTIAATNFYVTKPTQVMIDMEYLLRCETAVSGISYNDLIVTAQYYYDNQFLDFRQPKETYTDGEHILRLFYPLNVQDSTYHDWEVKLNASGGSIAIDITQALNIMSGQGLVESDWSGKLDIKENIPIIAIGMPPRLQIVEIQEIVNASQQVPIPGVINEIINTVEIERPNKLFINNIADGVLLGGLEE